MDKRLKLETILKFVESNSQSRCYTEAEEILASNHLITCGLKSKQSKEVSVEAVCLRSSAIKQIPHNIQGKFEKNKDGWSIIEIECSCKAGKSQRCKHCVAVLLYCNRNNIENLEELSSTDRKCSWNTVKSNFPSYVHPIPVRDFCHTKPVIEHYMSEEAGEKFIQGIMDVAPNSIFAKHKARYLEKRKRESEPIPASIINETSEIEIAQVPDSMKLLENILMGQLSPHLKCNIDAFDLDPEVKSFYINNIQITFQESKAIAMETTSQNCDVWMNERKKRITGSIAYELFTYSRNSNPDWKKKIDKLLNPSIFSNKAMDHGKKFEGLARQSYSDSLHCKFFQLGLLIHPAIPFLGYSPDGIIMDHDGIKLLEIKCPIIGNMKKAVDVIVNLNYIVLGTSGEYRLKKKHKYYGQVQLGMFLTGASACHFIIFANFDNSFVKINVEKDILFIQNMISALYDVYFTHMLPSLV